MLVRPSFVLGGRAMEIVANEKMLRKYLKTAVEVDEDKPVLIDKYLLGKEVEVDAVCDGKQVFLPGIMELVERTGVHSGDSTSVYPPFSLSEKVKNTIIDYTTKLGIGIGIGVAIAVEVDPQSEDVAAYGDTIDTAYAAVDFLMVIVQNGGSAGIAVEDNSTFNGELQHTIAVNIMVGLDIHGNTCGNADVAETLNEVCLGQYLIVVRC